LLLKKCPKCGSQNQIDDTKKLHGRYYCGSCRAVIYQVNHHPSWLAALSGIWALLLLGVTIIMRIGPELTWLGSLNLYLPQCVYALPGVVILPCYLLASRRYSWIPLLLLAYVFGPLMGLALPIVHSATGGSRTPIRVMTYNVKWAEHGAEYTEREIKAERPDILQFQDANGVLRFPEIEAALPGYNVRTTGQFIFASKFPIKSFDSMTFPVSRYQFSANRTVVSVNGTDLALWNSHLLSPRNGLNAVRRKDVAEMLDNASVRYVQSQALAGALKMEKLPFILTGDMNAPLGSLVCDTILDAGLKDAFAESGRGYGYSYGRFTRIGTPYVRIDHIFFSRAFAAKYCWNGGVEGSDHVPVYADLELLGRAGRRL